MAGSKFASPDQLVTRRRLRGGRGDEALVDVLVVFFVLFFGLGFGVWDN